MSLSMSIRSTYSMNLGKLAKSREYAKTSPTGRLIVTARATIEPSLPSRREPIAAEASPFFQIDGGASSWCPEHSSVISFLLSWIEIVARYARRYPVGEVCTDQIPSADYMAFSIMM